MNQFSRLGEKSNLLKINICLQTLTYRAQQQKENK